MSSKRGERFLLEALRKVAKDAKASARERLDACDRLALMGKHYKIDLAKNKFVRMPKLETLPPTMQPQPEPEDDGAELLKTFNRTLLNSKLGEKNAERVDS